MVAQSFSSKIKFAISLVTLFGILTQQSENFTIYHIEDKNISIKEVALNSTQYFNISREDFPSLNPYKINLTLFHDYGNQQLRPASAFCNISPISLFLNQENEIKKEFLSVGNPELISHNQSIAIIGEDHILYSFSTDGKFNASFNLSQEFPGGTKTKYWLNYIEHLDEMMLFVDFKAIFLKNSNDIHITEKQSNFSSVLGTNQAIDTVRRKGRYFFFLINKRQISILLLANQSRNFTFVRNITFIDFPSDIIRSPSDLNVTDI